MGGGRSLRLTNDKAESKVVWVFRQSQESQNPESQVVQGEDPLPEATEAPGSDPGPDTSLLTTGSLGDENA